MTTMNSFSPFTRIDVHALSPPPSFKQAYKNARESVRFQKVVLKRGTMSK